MQPHSSGDGGPAPALTRIAVTHPWAVLSAWIAIVAVLGVIGLGIDGKLSAGGLQVSGSESSHARALIGGNFGDSATVPVLLRGPRADVKRQGKALTATLAKRPGIRVLSPWTTSSGRTALRPAGDRALLLLSVNGTHEQIAARSQAVEALVAKATSAPVRATVTGLPLLTRDGTRSSLAAVHRAELIALPLLLLALLLVFRSPLAAAIPVVFGAATIAASTGALALLAGAVRLDAFALAVSCMVGLALAVDYSLLFVSRLREEIAGGRHEDIESAVGSATAPTTRTVAAAAAAIVVAMGVAAAMSPGTALLAAAIGVTVVAVLAAATAMLAVPAILVVAGPWLDAGQRARLGGAGGPRLRQSRPPQGDRRGARNPAPAWTPPQPNSQSVHPQPRRRSHLRRGAAASQEARQSIRGSHSPPDGREDAAISSLRSSVCSYSPPSRTPPAMPALQPPEVTAVP